MESRSFDLGRAPQRLCAVRPGAKVGYFRGEKRGAQRLALRLFHRPLETWELAGLAGASEGAEVEVGTLNAALYVEVFQPATSYYHVVQRIRQTDDGLVVVIDAFRMRASVRRRGLGAAIFARQLVVASALGIRRFETLAGRHADENGYYTWPRFGFDGPLPEAIRRKLPPGLDCAANVLDLMRWQKGRQWWKAHGIPLHLAFDLADQSRSRRAFERYLGQPDRPLNAHRPGPFSATVSSGRKPGARAGSPIRLRCARPPTACG